MKNTRPAEHYFKIASILLKQQKASQQHVQSLNTQKLYLESKNFENFTSSVIQCVQTKKLQQLLFHGFLALKSLDSPVGFIKMLIPATEKFPPTQFLVDMLVEAANYIEPSDAEFALKLLQRAVMMMQKMIKKDEVSTAKALILGMQGLIKISKTMKMLDGKKVKKEEIEEFTSEFINLKMPENSKYMFEKETLEFDLKMAKLSNTVYSETALSQNMLVRNTEPKCFMPVFQCYIENQDIYVVIRGTDGIMTDGITDSQFAPVFCLINGCSQPLHAGWLKAAIYVFKQVQLFIDFAQKHNKINRIVLTGHSYGAAVASILSIFFKSYQPNLEQYCVTFGCPPHVGARLADDTPGKHYINGNDPVARYSKLYIKQEAIANYCTKKFIAGQLSEWIENSQYQCDTDMWIPGNILSIDGGLITPVTRQQINIPDINFGDGNNHKISAYIQVLHQIQIKNK